MTTPDEQHPAVVDLRDGALDPGEVADLVGYQLGELAAAGIALVVADARTPDLPIRWVSPAFTDLTGYAPAEVLGRNCRFLQTGTTSEAVRRRMRATLDRGEPVRETLLNRRRDGSLFWNELLVSPVTSPQGVVTHFVGYQIDVTTRVTALAAHDRLLEAEERARSRARRLTAPAGAEEDAAPRA